MQPHHPPEPGPGRQDTIANVAILVLLILAIGLGLVMLSLFLNARTLARSAPDSSVAEQSEPSRTPDPATRFAAPTLPSTWTPSPMPTGGPTLTPSPTPTLTATPTGTSTKVPTPTATRTPIPTCPAESDASFDLVPFIGNPADRPDSLHGDLNLSLRGYSVTNAEHGLVDYNGMVDFQAPQLSGLFQPNRMPVISHVYRVNNWVYDPDRCGGNPHGCRGQPDDNWPVTLIGFATVPGETITIPERFPRVYPTGHIVLVLYAEEKRITIEYTREDTVGVGYAAHIEGVCVDPALLALYEAQTDGNGWHTTGHLPALRNDQPLGTAYGYEIQVAIRDNGMFMDPRSRKDWWQDQ